MRREGEVVVDSITVDGKSVKAGDTLCRDSVNINQIPAYSIVTALINPQGREMFEVVENGIFRQYYANDSSFYSSRESAIIGITERIRLDAIPKISIHLRVPEDTMQRLRKRVNLEGIELNNNQMIIELIRQYGENEDDD